MPIKCNNFIPIWSSFLLCFLTCTCSRTLFAVVILGLRTIETIFHNSEICIGNHMTLGSIWNLFICFSESITGLCNSSIMKNKNKKSHDYPPIMFTKKIIATKFVPRKSHNAIWHNNDPVTMCHFKVANKDRSTWLVLMNCLCLSATHIAPFSEVF